MAGKRRILTSDQYGFGYDDRVIPLNMAARATSVHGFSNLHVPVYTFPPGFSGKIVDFQIGVDLPAVSAANFAAADNGVTAFPRINSVAVMSTNPVIGIAGSAGQAARTTTMGTGTVALITSGVVNAASNALAAGDEITITWDAKSAGSGAATAAGVGLYGAMIIRFYSA